MAREYLNHQIYELSCKVCGELITPETVYLNFTNKKYMARKLLCKRCECKAVKRRGETKEGEDRRWRSNLRRMHNKNAPEMWEALCIEQDNRCAICGKTESTSQGKAKKNTRLSFDHCHKSGLVRGLLCNRCNIGLGYFDDEKEQLKLALEYLECHG